MSRSRLNIRPLSDQGVLVSFDQDEAACAFATQMRAVTASWLIDVVPAYGDVAVFYDTARITYEDAAELLRTVKPQPDAAPGRIHHIPCCYEHGPDLEETAELLNCTIDELIAAHLGETYRVCAIGFCPGFPYLGYLPDVISGAPRLGSPRLRVEPGSVGLVGRQTGIYPLARPGGWRLISKTPLTLVNVEDGFFPIKVGDEVRFERIDTGEFSKLDGERLVV